MKERRVAAYMKRDSMGRITFRLDKQTREAVERQAAAVGLSTGAWIRSLLVKTFWPNGRKFDPPS